MATHIYVVQYYFYLINRGWGEAYNVFLKTILRYDRKMGKITGTWRGKKPFISELTPLAR